MLTCLALLPLLHLPGATADGEVLVVRGERVIVAPGVELENATVLVQDGVILDVGVDVQAPEGARVVEGAVVCAGFLDPWSVLGLDGASVNDQNTTASTRSSDAIDPYTSDHLREEALRAGVVAVRAQVGSSSRIGGLGAMLGLAGALPEVVLDDVCVQLTVGVTRGGRGMDLFERAGEVDRVVSMIESGRSYRESWVEYEAELAAWEEAIAASEAELDDDFSKAKKKRDKEIEEAEEDGEEFEEERYREDRRPKAPRQNPDDAVMARIANGEIPLVVEVHRPMELRKLLADTARFDRLRLIIAGGSGSLALAGDLASRDVPVLVWPRAHGASGPADFRSAGLGLAAELDEAGVEVLLGSGGRDAAGTRDLPLLAAMAVGQGLDSDAAFEALTLGAARAMDVADQLGSLEFGKRAAMLVLDGDPLASTSSVQYVISDGEVVVEP